MAGEAGQLIAAAREVLGTGVPEEEVVRKAEMLTLNHLQSSLDRLTLLADIRVAFHQLAAALYLYEGPHQLRKQYQLSAISTLEDMPGTMDAVRATTMACRCVRIRCPMPALQPASRQQRPVGAS